MKATLTIRIVLIVAVILGFFVYIGHEANNKIIQKRCSAFKTQREALKHYQSSLDRDRDGKPCENLPK
ncbi:MAG: excalibur calcium-binding domain-containing protein [Patescibacteria group bacterium]